MTQHGLRSFSANWPLLPCCGSVWPFLTSPSTESLNCRDQKGPLEITESNPCYSRFPTSGEEVPFCDSSCCSASPTFPAPTCPFPRLSFWFINRIMNYNLFLQSFGCRLPAGEVSAPAGRKHTGCRGSLEWAFHCSVPMLFFPLSLGQYLSFFWIFH